MKDVAATCMLASGVVLVVYGISRISVTAAIISCGILLILYGFGIHKMLNEKKKTE